MSEPSIVRADEVSKLLDEAGEWIGLRIVETITVEEFRQRYPDAPHGVDEEIQITRLP